MKRLCSTILLAITITITSYAQWTVNGNTNETTKDVVLTNSSGQTFNIFNNLGSLTPVKLYVGGNDYTRGLQIGSDTGNHPIGILGKVGIGNLGEGVAGTSLDHLVIGNGTNSQGVVLHHGSGSSAAYSFIDNTGALRSRLLYRSTTDILSLQYGGSDRITIVDDQIELLRDTDVNGTVRSKEVIVEATNWPDYVFQEGYTLPTLSELEIFIAANKHLPEVPTAQEVEEKGVELGEMNKILLKKMEEMTLYMIELKKENQVLAERLDKIEGKRK